MAGTLRECKSGGVLKGAARMAGMRVLMPRGSATAIISTPLAYNAATPLFDGAFVVNPTATANAVLAFPAVPVVTSTGADGFDMTLTGLDQFGDPISEKITKTVLSTITKFSTAFSVIQSIQTGPPSSGALAFTGANTFTLGFTYVADGQTPANVTRIPIPFRCDDVNDIRGIYIISVGAGTFTGITAPQYGVKVTTPLIGEYRKGVVGLTLVATGDPTGVWEVIVVPARGVLDSR